MLNLKIVQDNSTLTVCIIIAVFKFVETLYKYKAMQREVCDSTCVSPVTVRCRCCRRRRRGGYCSRLGVTIRRVASL